MLLNKNIVLLTLISVVALETTTTKSMKDYSEENSMDFTSLARKYGYTSEQHTVITEDGYILKLYRMTSKSCEKLRKPPVLLMHGLLLSSDIWLDAGPNVSLAYLLADDCYDIWVGNSRGNYLGRDHVKLNPDSDKEFWDFSSDEMGLFDVPAIIDRILDESGSSKINYIGYSQGGGIFAMMCSEKPEQCVKVETFIGLAPALRMLNTKSNVFRLTSNFFRSFSDYLSSKGIHEVFSKNSLTQQLLEFFCKFEESAVICNSVLSLVDSFNPGSIKERTIRNIFYHLPGGTSVKNFIKYAQTIDSGKFQKFDYGRRKNLEIYENETAPEYDLSKMKLPVVLIQGLGDNIIDITDVQWLQETLPNAVLKVVDHPLWNHFDMTFSELTPKLIFPIVNEHLQRHLIK